MQRYINCPNPSIFISICYSLHQHIQVIQILVARACTFLQQPDMTLTVGSIRTVLEHVFFLFDVWAEKKLQLHEASSSSANAAPHAWPGWLDQVEGLALACLARPETSIRSISFRLMASVDAFVQGIQSVGQPGHAAFCGCDKGTCCSVNFDVRVNMEFG